MKATIKFNLDHPDDSMAHTRCLKSLDLAIALHRIVGLLRNKEDEDNVIAQKILHAVYKELNELGIVLEDLID